MKLDSAIFNIALDVESFELKHIEDKAGKRDQEAASLILILVSRVTTSSGSAGIILIALIFVLICLY